MRFIVCSLLILPSLSAYREIPTEEDEYGILVEVPEPPETWGEGQRPPGWGYFSSDVHRCIGAGISYPDLADDLDMKKLMGRWFVGLADSFTSRPTPACHTKIRFHKRCIMYEFGRLIIDRNEVIFDVTKTYRGYEGREKKDFGYAFSSGPRYAMMELTRNEIPHQKIGLKFWICAVGAESEDSFGRLQYEYAIFCDCSKKWPGMVLVRSPETVKDYHKKDILDWLKTHNYSVEGYRQPSYNNCDYTDSFTEIMGE